MNPMGHNVPNILGVTQKGLEKKICKVIPGYMKMGETGMAAHADHVDHLAGSKNILPMMMGKGLFGNIEMDGMFTVVKVRDNLRTYDNDPGWYKHPEGTVAYRMDRA